jgi:hypothetical protein
MKLDHGRRICIGLAALILATTLDVRAATRPVSIGVNANFEQNLALNAHLGWSRIDILWSQVNPQPGVWDFTLTDAGVNNAVGWGQQILAILHHVPAWLTTDPDIPPYTTAEWSEFVRRVAQRYAGRIAAYEIWNEPDQKSFSKDGIGWGRNIEEPPLYVDFVHAAAVEIRSQAPGTLVVAPSFESRNTGMALTIGSDEFFSRSRRHDIRTVLDTASSTSSRYITTRETPNLHEPWDGGSTMRISRMCGTMRHR